MFRTAKGADRRLRRQCTYAFPLALFAVLALVLFTAVAGAQEIVALVPVVPLEGTAAGSTAGENPLTQYAPLITESLRIALTNAGFAVKSVPELTEFQKIWPEAEAVSATIAVYGTAAIAEDRLVIQLTAYQVSTKQIITGSMANGRVDLSLYNVIDNGVADLATKVVKWVADNPLEKLKGTRQLLRSLTLESPDDGEAIYLPGGERLGTIQEGRLTTVRLSAPIGSTVVVEKRKRGYVTERQSIRITRTDERAKLRALWPTTYIATDLMWILGFPVGGGAGLRLFAIPDWLYGALNFHLAVQPSTVANGHSVYHLISYGALGSYLFWGPMSHFRFSLSVGAGLATTYFTAPGTGSAFDAYISFLNPTFYANFRHVYGFVRGNMWWVLQSADGLLESGLMGTNGPPPITFGVGYKW